MTRKEGHPRQRGQQSIQRHGDIKLQVSLAAINTLAFLKHEFQVKAQWEDRLERLAAAVHKRPHMPYAKELR